MLVTHKIKLNDGIQLSRALAFVVLRNQNSKEYKEIKRKREKWNPILSVWFIKTGFGISCLFVEKPNRRRRRPRHCCRWNAFDNYKCKIGFGLTVLHLLGFYLRMFIQCCCFAPFIQRLLCVAANDTVSLITYIYTHSHRRHIQTNPNGFRSFSIIFHSVPRALKRMNASRCAYVICSVRGKNIVSDRPNHLSVLVRC